MVAAVEYWEEFSRPTLNQQKGECNVQMDLQSVKMHTERRGEERVKGRIVGRGNEGNENAKRANREYCFTIGLSKCTSHVFKSRRVSPYVAAPLYLYWYLQMYFYLYFPKELNFQMYLHLYFKMYLSCFPLNMCVTLFADIFAPP